MTAAPRDPKGVFTDDLPIRPSAWMLALAAVFSLIVVTVALAASTKQGDVARSRPTALPERIIHTDAPGLVTPLPVPTPQLWLKTSRHKPTPRHSATPKPTPTSTAPQVTQTPVTPPCSSDSQGLAPCPTPPPPTYPAQPPITPTPSAEPTGTPTASEEPTPPLASESFDVPLAPVPSQAPTAWIDPVPHANRPTAVIESCILTPTSARMVVKVSQSSAPYLLYANLGNGWEKRTGNTDGERFEFVETTFLAKPFCAALATN